MNPVTTLIESLTQDHPETTLFVTGMLTGLALKPRHAPLRRFLRALGKALDTPR